MKKKNAEEKKNIIWGWGFRGVWEIDKYNHLFLTMIGKTLKS